jgi:HEAT repeat protein
MIRGLVLRAVAISLTVRLAGTPREADSEPDPTVTRWLALLRDEDATRQRAAAYSLKEPGPAAMNAVPTLVTALQDGDAIVHRAAASALGEVRRKPTHAVPALVRALKDADPDVRQHATIALAKIGLPAVPSLIELLEGTDVPADPDRPPAALHPEDARLADYPAVSLAEIGPSAVPALIEAVRLLACSRLERVKAADPPVVAL